MAFVAGASGVGGCRWGHGGAVAGRGRACWRRTVAMKFEVGSKVRVTADGIKMYHIPTSRNEALDVKGLEGTIVKLIYKHKGVEITSTKPLRVKFEDPRFMAHFDENELEEI